MDKKFIIPDTITEKELQTILKGTTKPDQRLAFALGFYGCMRLSEVTNLTPKDINREQKLIHIRQAKGNKDRMIPIPPEVIGGLRHLPVKVGRRALQKNIKQLSIKYLKKDIHFHTLRHSGITHYISVKNWSSLNVQRLAGHSKIQTTEIYTHIRPEQLVKTMWE